MLKDYNVRYSIAGTCFQDFTFPTTIEVDEDDYCFYARMYLDPWDTICLSLDKAVCPNHDHAFEMFKKFVKSSYYIKN